MSETLSWTAARRIALRAQGMGAARRSRMPQPAASLRRKRKRGPGGNARSRARPCPVQAASSAVSPPQAARMTASIYSWLNEKGLVDGTLEENVGFTNDYLEES